MSLNDNTHAGHSRRHSSADVLSRDLINFNSMYRTPQAPFGRKPTETMWKELANAPMKKQKSRASRRASVPQAAIEGRSTICKKLDFSDSGLGGSGKKRMHPLMTALHYNDVAVPLSELELTCPKKTKRVRFSDETTTSPTNSPFPETPTYNTGFRFHNSQVKCDQFTKVTGPLVLGTQVNGKTLFKNTFSSPSKRISSYTPARNLNLLME